MSVFDNARALRTLLNLLADFPGITVLLGPRDSIPDFDYYSLLLGVPGVLMSSTPPAAMDFGSVPYLPLPQHYVNRWNKRWLDEYSGIQQDTKVGLVWAGNPNHNNDRNRSMSLSLFRPLLDVSQVCFFSLQKEFKTEDMAELFHFSATDRWHDMASFLPDLADTAALIEHLDLVITVDTALAHLAGALGKPVWLLIPFAPDWRWQLARDDSPWYPSMRIFRQKDMGQWEDVILRVKEALQQWVLTIDSGTR